jgi:hypothetical protein
MSVKSNLDYHTISNLSLRGTERLRGVAEANSEIPRFARNKLRNPMKNEIATPAIPSAEETGTSVCRHGLWARNDNVWCQNM